MRLRWELLDLKQGHLADLGERIPGAKIELGLNGARRATLPLSLEDEARALADPLTTVLRAVLIDGEDETILFHGRVLPEEKGAEEGESLTLAAADPFSHLSTLLIRYQFESDVKQLQWDGLSFSGIDQSQIMWAIVNSIAGHGVKKGTLAAASVARDYFALPGRYIGEVLAELAELDNGVDFELVPVEATDGSLVRLDTHYPQQGADKSATVKLVYGTDPNTAAQFSFVPGGDIVNRAVVLLGLAVAGGIHSGVICEHPASIEEFGPFETTVTQDVGSITPFIDPWPILKDYAKALVGAGAYPVEFFTVTPRAEEDRAEEAGAPPKFAPEGDYWIGDTIACDVHEPDGTVRHLKGRVTDAAITETASGQLQTELTCAPAPSTGGVTEPRLIYLDIPSEESE